MNRVKYNENEQPIIYLVATPIGNLQEISFRMIEVLNEVEYIFCEDTRVSSKLLNHLKIKGKQLESYHLHNEYEKCQSLIKCALENKKIALLSDAGYPLICDPGAMLVKMALEENINIVVINGPSALLPALINSGFNPLPFSFLGFIPHKTNDAIEKLSQYKEYKHTLIFYESCHRLNKSLKILLDVFENAPICISREITKLNEEHIHGTIEELLMAQLELKGELVITLDNSMVNEKIELDEEFIIEKINECLNNQKSKKDAIKIVAKKYGLDKNYVYSLVHKK